jgi:hypothetical protein
MFSNHTSEICQKIGTVLCITSTITFVRNAEALKIIGVNRVCLILQKPEGASLLSL